MEDFLSLKDIQINQTEFATYTGKDLKLWLGKTTSEIDRFIYRKQLSVDTYLETKFFARPSTRYWELTDFQKMHYKIGVMEQILYELRNGEMATDSGYNGDIGAVIHADYLEYITLGNDAKRHFVLAGMLTSKIRGRNVFDFGGYYD